MATLGLAYLCVDLVSRELDAGRGTYAAFGQNLLMSGLFLAMLAARRAWPASRRGSRPPISSVPRSPRSRSGTGATYPHSGLLLYLCFAILLLDLAYLAASSWSPGRVP